MLDSLIMTWDSTAHLASLRFCWFLECDMNALFPSWGLHRCSYDWRYLLPAHGRQLHGLMYGTFPYMQVTMYFCNWWWMIRENRRYSLTHASIKPITRRIAESNKFSVICRTRYCHFSLWGFSFVVCYWLGWGVCCNSSAIHSSVKTVLETWAYA